MTGSLFRRLLWMALLLTGATLFAVDYTFTTYLHKIREAGMDAEASQIRTRMLAIFLTSSFLAIGVAFLVSRSRTLRIRRLKLLAKGLPGGTARDYPMDSSDELAALERAMGGVAMELQKLLDRLRFESARREAILSGMTEGVLAVDHELRATFCNAAFLKAVDFRGASPEGQYLLALVRDPRLHELLRSVLHDGQALSLRLQLSTAHSRTFEVNAGPIEMPSGRGAIAILHDITDLERLEQVRKDFIANVSHEFRTPLAGIIGYADTLLDGAIDDEKNRRNFVEIIRSNAVRLNSIASDLLVLSDLESGNERDDAEILSVRGVLGTVLVTVAGEARLRDVKLVRENLDDVYVAGSRLRLEQALLNLIANAIKFNRPGGEVRVRAGYTSQGQVEIVISDTGVGIPSQDVPRIFERFYRVDKARSRQVGGTGLGLSIVKHVVERIKGAISVESQLGRGSSFRLQFPTAMPHVTES
jgi:two-component system phosphate regulon sensor histidine kinase PhoR